MTESVALNPSSQASDAEVARNAVQTAEVEAGQQAAQSVECPEKLKVSLSVALKSRSLASDAEVARSAVQTAEVEAAQQAAQSALMAEMDLVRRQKVALEEHSRRLELQVCASFFLSCRGSLCNMAVACKRPHLSF